MHSSQVNEQQERHHRLNGFFPRSSVLRVTLIRASFFPTSSSSSSSFHEYMQQSYKLLNHPDNNGKQIDRKRGKRQGLKHSHT